METLPFVVKAFEVTNARNSGGWILVTDDVGSTFGNAAICARLCCTRYTTDVGDRAELFSRTALTPYVTTGIQEARVKLCDIIPGTGSPRANYLWAAYSGGILRGHRRVTFADADDLSFLQHAVATSSETPCSLVDFYDARDIDSEAIGYHFTPV